MQEGGVDEVGEAGYDLGGLRGGQVGGYVGFVGGEGGG